MRSSTKLGALVAVAATTAGLLAGPAAAAHVAPIFYVGYASGTTVTAASGVVTSGPTAASFVEGISYPADDTNTIADTNVSDLITTGAVDTSDHASKTATGAQLVSRARTAGTRLLGGLVKVGVIDTTATSTIDGTTFSASTTTQLANIRIANIDLPVTIPENYSVTIPGIASLTLNYTASFKVSGAVSTLGAGVLLTLLADRNGYAAGAQVMVNPVLNGLATHIPNTPVLLGGTAYGTQVAAGVSNLVGVTSGPTARQDLGSAGTNGAVLTNSTAGVSVPGILQGGAIQTTVRGIESTRTGDARTTARVAGVNLLDGLIKARAITASARVHAYSPTRFTTTDSSQLLGLRIAGHAYNTNVAPNTVIDVAGLGTITLNQQLDGGYFTQVRALVITLSTARAGLPVGAVIEVGVASAFILA